MGRQAPEILVSRADVARIEELVTKLPSQARVRIRLRNGRVLAGTVIERPAAQMFEDASGAEGMNAVVRLDDPAAPPWTVYVWLSDIAAVDRIDDAAA